MKDRFKPVAVIMILCLGVIVYSNSIHCSFHFDDWRNINYNYAIRDIHDLHKVLGFLPRRCILYLTLALNYHFNGLNVSGYHVFNLAVHLATAVLVWWLVLLTFSTPAMKEEKISQHADLIALLAALIFVAHPIQTQAVTYIVQRAASMAALFYLLSMCLYIKSRQSFKQIATSPSASRKDTSHRRYYISALIAAIFSMFTKETAITLPLMILLYEFTFFNSFPTKFPPPGGQGQGGGTLKYLTPFALTIFIIPVTMLLTETGAVRLHQLQSEPGISSTHYLLTQFRVIVTYIRLLFLPVNQNLLYDYPVYTHLCEAPVLASLAFLMAILFLAKRLFSKYRLISFSIFWFFIALLPESSFLPIKDVIYEHRLYLPMVGFSIFLAGGMYYLVGRHSLRTMIILMTGIIIFYSILAYQRNLVWSDELTLWDDVIHKSPHNATAYLTRAAYFSQHGDLDRSRDDLNQCIALDPRYSDAYTDLGVIDERQGQTTQALLEYAKAISLSPSDVQPYYNRALIYIKTGKIPQALADLARVIAIAPDDPKAYITRATIFSDEGNYEQAILDFNKAIDIDPSSAQAHMDLGASYGRQGKLTQAIAEFNKALEIEPNNKEVYKNRATAYYLLKRGFPLSRE